MFKKKRKKSQVVRAKKDRDTIRFSGRKHSKKGIFSSVIGMVAVLGFLTISMISGLNHGNGTMMLGVLGLMLLVFAVYGCYLSYQSFKERDIFYHFPITGMTLNGVLLILLFILYILGL